jgi:hypothetical protein
MRTFILAAAAAGALAAAAVPAAAQQRYQGDYNRGNQGGYDQRGDRGGVDYHLTSGYVDGLFWKLDNAAQEGRMSRREAVQLKRELRQVQEFANPVETGRASNWQYQSLQRTVARIDQALNSGGYRADNRYRNR